MYKGKNIIWKSKISQIFAISISFIFVAFAIYTRKEISFSLFIINIILFGFGGIFLLFRLLNTKNMFVTYDSKIGKEILKNDSEFKNSDFGYFQYSENGFEYELDLEKIKYNWTDIETVYGYKIDLLTYDEICIDIFTNDNKKLTITESDDGWFQFISRLSNIITEIKIDWYINISTPAFQKNLTLLFDKKKIGDEKLRTKYYNETK